MYMFIQIEVDNLIFAAFFMVDYFINLYFKVLEEEEDFTLTDYSTLVSDNKDQQTDANGKHHSLMIGVHLE